MTDLNAITLGNSTPKTSSPSVESQAAEGVSFSQVLQGAETKTGSEASLGEAEKPQVGGKKLPESGQRLPSKGHGKAAKNHTIASTTDYRPDQWRLTNGLALDAGEPVAKVKAASKKVDEFSWATTGLVLDNKDIASPAMPTVVNPDHVQKTVEPLTQDVASIIPSPIVTAPVNMPVVAPITNSNLPVDVEPVAAPADPTNDWLNMLEAQAVALPKAGLNDEGGVRAPGAAIEDDAPNALLQNIDSLDMQPISSNETESQKMLVLPHLQMSQSDPIALDEQLQNSANDGELDGEQTQANAALTTALGVKMPDVDMVDSELSIVAEASKNAAPAAMPLGASSRTDEGGVSPGGQSATVTNTTPIAATGAVTTTVGTSAVSTPVQGKVDLYIDTPFHHPEWENELSEHIEWMVQSNRQEARIHLNPVELGPIEVSLSIHDQDAVIQFVAQHAATREAVEAALPRLREMMGDAGLNVQQVNVDANASRQELDMAGSNNHEQQEAREPAPRYRSQDERDAADEAPTQPAVTTLSKTWGNSLIDAYV